jgi:hypothetical protein
LVNIGLVLLDVIVIPIPDNKVKVSMKPTDTFVPDMADFAALAARVKVLEERLGIVGCNSPVPPQYGAGTHVTCTQKFGHTGLHQQVRIWGDNAEYIGW